MSDLAVAIQSILADVSVDADGVVRMTKNALCNLLQISRSSFSVPKLSALLRESLTANGFQVIEDVPMFENGIPDTALVCIISHYAQRAKVKSPIAQQLLMTFGAVGIRAFFQDATGWKRAKVPTEMTQPEVVGELIKIASQFRAIGEYASNKPGLKHQLDSAIKTGGELLPGYTTVNNILRTTGREFTISDRKAIGMYASTAYRNFTGKRPEKVIERRTDKNGKMQTSWVSAYPLDFLPVIVIELGFGSSH